MNLIIIPFHDWRKSEKEGFRTRDVHLINALSKLNAVEKILVINRPTTRFELFYKKLSYFLNGKVILKRKNFFLTEINTKVYVADYISNDILGQILYKQSWFFKTYGNKSHMNFIKACISELKIEDNNLIVQNIFSYKCAEHINSNYKLVDAWDNFLKFPAYQKFKAKINDAYSTLSESIPFWITNSSENIENFKTRYNVKKIYLLKNGLNVQFAETNLPIPKDLDSIKRPIIGYGGKISYLIDTELINYIAKRHPHFSFVFVGQILDKTTYNKIIKRENVYFLGDKHYQVYPSYVNHFDVCIVPYNIDEKQHGGDSIKAYEYLATKKKVIGTKGNGLLDLKDFIYLVNNKEEFSKELKFLQNEKPHINSDQFSWESKSKKIINWLNNFDA